MVNAQAAEATQAKKIDRLFVAALFLESIPRSVFPQAFRIWLPACANGSVWAQILMHPADFVIVLVSIRNALTLRAKGLICFH